MKAPIIKRYNLEFTNLVSRPRTDMIVIHHTGAYVDNDLSAERIHAMHLMNGWAGCGYHYIIRKDGTIEAGRPEWAQGAHAEYHNLHSIGVHLCGNFEFVPPTAAQIEAAAYLIGWLCEKYNIAPIDKNHIVGHRDLMITACPGRFLYDCLQTIRGKAIWYQQHY